MTDHLIERLRLRADRMATANCEMCHEAANELEASQARIAELEAALLVMVNHEVNYMDNNNLGNPEEQHRIKQARAALKPKP